MIRYAELVDYIKENHINWNTDLFEVLKSFFEQYYQPQNSPTAPLVQQEIVFPERGFTPPADGDYTSEDLINLFSS